MNSAIEPRKTRFRGAGADTGMAFMLGVLPPLIGIEPEPLSGAP